jgi:hypothetical protein
LIKLPDLGAPGMLDELAVAVGLLLAIGRGGLAHAGRQGLVPASEGHDQSQ